ncbi:MAG: zinc metalloprotease HtpX [Candidatus Woesearchaeota archaeon]
MNLKSIENQIKTIVLLGLLTALLLWLGNYFAGSLGLTFAFIIVLVMNLISYFFSDKIVLALYRAKEVQKDSRIYKLVSEVVNKFEIPMPKVYLIKTNNPNAFATGRNPKNSAVAFTEGILNLLNDDELKGVIAHELSHIKNRDTLIATIASVIAGTISYLASMARWAAFFGGFNERERGKSLLELLVLAILAPLIALIIQLAISRQREYLADSTAAKITKKPNYLADALLKIEKGVKENPLNFGTETTASLFIANPFNANALLNLFSTHPSIKDRVEKLRKMKF